MRLVRARQVPVQTEPVMYIKHNMYAMKRKEVKLLVAGNGNVGLGKGFVRD